jgi:uncharacterized protein (TIGR02246 family)
MKIIAILAVLLPLAAAVAQTPKPNPPPQAAAASLSKADDQSIRKTISAFEEAWNAHDMQAFAKVFLQDAEWVNAVGMHWRGRDAVMAATTLFHETFLKTNQMKLDAVETRLLGAGYAIAVATITQDGFTAPDGAVFPKTQDRETFVLAKGPNGWLIAHGHNTRIDAEAAKHDPVNGPAK